MISLTDNLFIRSEITLFIISFICFTIVYIVTLKYQDKKQERKHQKEILKAKKELEEVKREYTPKEAKELLKLIKETYN